MNKSIPAVNYLFMLAYAYEYGWDYLRQDIGKEDVENLSLFEVQTLMLALWSKRLITTKLYKSFQRKREQTQRLRGKILFGQDMQSGRTNTATLTCEYDEVSFDVIENQIILATLNSCRREISKLQEQSGITNSRKKSRIELEKRLNKVYRRLSSEITLRPIQREDFRKITYTRANQHYEPVINLCKLLLGSDTFSGDGGYKSIDKPEDQKSEVFERFLLGYLKEQFADTDLQVKKDSHVRWVYKEYGEIEYIPTISPDIVVRKQGKPIMVLDAKFYETAVKPSRFNAEDKPDKFKTHSSNLYQILSYINYYNCDGLLVYAQTERGHFDEMVKIKSDHYSDNQVPKQQFGFYTLDASKGLDHLKKSMKQLENKIRDRAEVSTALDDTERQSI